MHPEAAPAVPPRGEDGDPLLRHLNPEQRAAVTLPPVPALILAGAVVGKIQERLAAEVQSTRMLNVDLQHHQAELHQANLSLRESSENLVSMNRSLQGQQEELARANTTLQERSAELEQSKRAVESLKAKVEEALYSTMDASVVNLLIEGRLRNEKHNLSVFFSDLFGFSTYLEEHPPEVVIKDLNRYIGDVEPILLTYRGHINKYMGDGIMVEFGAPLEYEKNSLLAVLAGIKIQEKMAQQNYPWKMRIGISSGTTITGLIGAKRQTFTAIGDVVNTAARLERACPHGKVLIDRQTFENIDHVIETRKKRDVSTKDESTPRRNSNWRRCTSNWPPVPIPIFCSRSGASTWSCRNRRKRCGSSSGRWNSTRAIRRSRWPTPKRASRCTKPTN